MMMKSLTAIVVVIKGSIIHGHLFCQVFHEKSMKNKFRGHHT